MNPTRIGQNIKPLLVLSMAVLLFGLIALVTGFKLSHIGWITFSVSSLSMPFYYLTTDVLAEIYGVKLTRFIVIVGLSGNIIFSIFCMFLVYLPAPGDWHYQAYFEYIFGGDTLRQALAGVLAVLVSQYLNIHLLAKWKILLQGRYFWLRSMGASSVGELIMSLMTGFITFFGTSDQSVIIQIAILGCTLKLLLTSLLCFPNTLLANYLKMKNNMKFEKMQNPLM